MSFGDKLNVLLNRKKISESKNTDIVPPVFVKEPTLPGQIGNTSGERVVQGLDESTAKLVLYSLSKLEKYEENSSEQTWIEYLNDPNLFWPKGKRLLPDPSKLPSVDLLNESKQLASAGMLALTILTTTNIGDVQAQTPKESKLIEWAIEAYEKIDPINYLINRKSHGEKYEHKGFSPEAKKILTWNLYHEVRGDKGDQGAGIYGVLLSSLERMKTRKLSPEQVVFQQYQYSWTNDIVGKGLSPKVDVDSYIKLRDIVDEFTNGNSLDMNITMLKAKIMKMTGLKSVPDLTHYHRFGMFDSDSAKIYKIQAKQNTIDRIKEIEMQYKADPKNPKIIKLGKHLFYPDKKF